MTTQPKSRSLLAAALALTALSIACSPGSPGDAADAGAAGLPADHPAVGSAQAGTAGPLAMTGVVAETMSGGGYTYVRLTLADAERWIAGPLTELAVGDTVAVSGLMFMGEFDSPSLGRSFDEMYFASSFGKPGAATAMGMPGHAEIPSSRHPGGDDVAPLVQARVTQVLAAGSFVYLEVEAEGMRQWLAAPATEVTEGATVSWRGGSLMEDFQSPSLGRTFAKVLFVQAVSVVD